MKKKFEDIANNTVVKPNIDDIINYFKNVKETVKQLKMLINSLKILQRDFLYNIIFSDTLYSIEYLRRTAENLKKPHNQSREYILVIESITPLLKTINKENLMDRIVKN